MDRLGLRARRGALGRAGSAAASATSTAPPGKGKFKLRAAKEPLPLLTEKDSSRETKPRPTFLKSAGASASADKTKNSKPSVFAANSFARPPPAKDSLKMRTGGFSFTKFQPKTGETKKVAGDSSGKAVPTLAAAKPFLGKFSVSGLNKKTAKSASDDGSKAGKGPLFKAQVKGSLPFTFRADTKSSAAKKRKTAESVAHQDKKNAFPCKSFRTEGFALKGLARSSKGVNTGKQPPNCDVASEKAQRGGIRSSFSIAAKKGVMANDGAMLKKRGLALHPAETGPASKRSKRGPAQDVQQREGTADNVAEERMESGNSPADIVTSTNDASGASPGEPAPIGLERDTPPSVVGATESVQPAVLPPPSPDCREECLSGVEEELALKLVCSLDDDKEDEFLSRAAAIQDFTDRVGLEQKQISNRLLDAHADISESLLDALTDLMAEEGGIGIDKLVFDMNLDIDIDDAFLQEPELQVLH